MTNSKKITDHGVHLQELLVKAKTSGKPESIKELIDYIILSKGSEHSELILSNTITLVTQHPKFITTETMYLLEEAFYVACEHQDLEWANFFLNAVKAQFPKSVKIMRMLAGFHEASGDIVKAQDIYLDMIERNPEDNQTIKRLVSLYRDMDMLSQAVTLLNKYLECHQEDFEAWSELGEIYLQKQNYSKALFCYEEVLTHANKNYFINLKVAEILYSTQRKDRIDDLVDARKYFSHAALLYEQGVELGNQEFGKEESQKVSVRALFGIVKCCKSIQKLTQKPDPNNSQMLEIAQEQLRNAYSSGGASNSTVQAVNQMPSMQSE